MNRNSMIRWAGAGLSLMMAQGCAETPEETLGPEAGKDWTSPSIGMTFVWIEPLGIWVGETEVANAQYREKEPDHDSGQYLGRSLNGERQPAVFVNFGQAKAYAEWLSVQDGTELGVARYRLPSEEEWETFARCGDGREYPWGNAWPPRSGAAGNYRDEAYARAFDSDLRMEGYDDGQAATAPVDELWANPWGLRGVGGNVWEACAKDSSGESFGARRGGSWYGTYQADSMRIAHRSDARAGYRSNVTGFRLVLSR